MAYIYISSYAEDSKKGIYVLKMEEEKQKIFKTREKEKQKGALQKFWQKAGAHTNF